MKLDYETRIRKIEESNKDEYKKAMVILNSL